jgi:hypothetical protein
MYKFEILINSDRKNSFYPAIDAEDVSEQKLYFDNDYYNTYMPDDIYFDNLKMYKRIPIDPDPKFYNDFQFWAGEYPNESFSYPVSEKFKKVFELFNLCGCKFYSGNLKFEDKKIPFFVFHILKDIWFDNIEKSETIFCKRKIYNDIYLLDERIEIESAQELRVINEELAGNDLVNETDVEEYVEIALGEIHLKEEFDIIRLPNLHMCVSERLKNAIEEAGLTGIEFKAIEHVDFYCNGEKL